jgi:glycosyltransferase involved in cell wall biosynthesis
MADLLRLTPDTLEFMLLSFEGPDQYSMAGGLGVRMKELALELARQGFRTHLVFIGDPDLPALETPEENLNLHRWGQWLSAHYRGGVYQGEEAKLVDWNEQLPAYVVSRLVKPAVAAGRLTAVLAEEWHTAYSTCQLSDRLYYEGVRDKALLLWNANNVMGFDRIDWRRLDFCSQITTVSRYMKHVMWERAVNPLVIPNGIPGDRVKRADPDLVGRLRAAFPDRELVFKIGRFSPDKRWNMAVDALAGEKRSGQDVATVIRGGVEPHGAEVLANARSQGLTVVDVRPPRDPAEAIEALAQTPRADVYNIASFMSDELISLFYTAADAVLANSGHEPFGLVGLEVMAAGGITFVGTTGEDYAVPFLNCIALDTDDPTEINIGLDFLRKHPAIVERMRHDAMETAESFSWKNVVEDTLLGKLRYVALRQVVTPPGKSKPTSDTEAKTARATKAGANKTGPAGPTAKSVAAGDSGATPTGDRPATETQTDSPPSGDSLPYGGEAMTRRPSIKPRSSEK